MKTRDFVFTIVGFLICWMLTLPLQKAYHERERAVERDTIYDTIAVVQPIPKDSLVVRYKTIAVRRELAATPIAAEPTVVGGLAADSITLPITSKHYADTLYDAWVSGFEPSLESIKIYPRTITERITAPAPPQKRWHIGPSIGIGVGAGGRIEPFVGASVTYSLISF